MKPLYPAYMLRPTNGPWSAEDFLVLLYTTRIHSVLAHPSMEAVEGVKYFLTFQNKPSVVPTFRLRLRRATENSGTDLKLPFLKFAKQVLPWKFSTVECNLSFLHLKKPMSAAQCCSIVPWRWYTAEAKSRRHLSEDFIQLFRPSPLLQASLSRSAAPGMFWSWKLV